MNSAEQPVDATKLKSEVRLAGLRLAKARRQLKSAKAQARVAKRRRKEAKQAARQARKQAKAARGEFKEAGRLLAEAKAKLARENRLRASARRREKAARKAASKTEAGNVEQEQPATAAPRHYEAPAPAPAIPEGSMPPQAGAGVGDAELGNAEDELRSPPIPGGNQTRHL